MSGKEILLSGPSTDMYDPAARSLLMSSSGQGFVFNNYYNSAGSSSLGVKVTSFMLTATGASQSLWALATKASVDQKHFGVSFQQTEDSLLLFFRSSATTHVAYSVAASSGSQQWYHAMTGVSAGAYCTAFSVLAS